MTELSLNSLKSGKANATHTHIVADIANLQTTLDGKASMSHTHTKSQISDFPTTLPANGGNADTISGHSWTDISNLVSSGYDAGHSFVQNGYQKLTNGLILQWGYYNITARGTYFTISFPIAFPNACLSVCVQPISTVTGVTVSTIVSSITKTTFVACDTNTNGANPINFIAIGY